VGFQIDQSEGHIPGSLARNCIIGALHFEFEYAQSQASFSEAKLKYKEDATNI
jgi:hypothetical protein